MEPRLLKVPRHRDGRGWVAEAWRQDWALPPMVQDNLSHSEAGVLRGLHFQRSPPQGKLLTVLTGRIWDVVVSLEEPRSWAFRLEPSEEALWIPPGFAHGFYAEEASLVWYKLSAPRDVASEGVIAWDDPKLDIPWPSRNPLLSERDRAGKPWPGR